MSQSSTAEGVIAPFVPSAARLVIRLPVADPGVTDDERRTIAEMMVKGTYAIIPAGHRPGADRAAVAFATAPSAIPRAT